MRERLLENWLDSANERTFEIPFCNLLAAQGYTVIHITRHAAMEMGKDVLAIDPDGVPCAFQLKSAPGRRITLGQWRDEIAPVLTDLMLGRIVHPSMRNLGQHRSFLVTNRDLDEEVSRAIDDLNRGWADRGQPNVRLHTIVRGNLLRMILDHTEPIWPEDSADARILMQLYLDDGLGLLPNEKIAGLLEKVMGLKADEKPSQTKLLRLVASSAVLTALAISPWTLAKNYASELGGWVQYIASILAACQRWGYPWTVVETNLELAKTTIKKLLAEICNELRQRTHLVEGNALVDPPVYRVRITRLVGLMSAYGLILKIDGLASKDAEDDLEFIRDFCNSRARVMLLWGEAAAPSFLAHFWFLKETDGSCRSDMLLLTLLEGIAAQNGKQGPSLADPYQNEEEALEKVLGLAVDDEDEQRRLPSGASYMAKGLLLLAVKRNWKQQLKLLWPAISRLAFLEFEPEEGWHYYLWRSEKGTNVIEHPPLTKQWRDLQTESSDYEGVNLPTKLKDDPVLLLLFLIVCPHRATPRAVNWLDRALRQF